MKCAFSFAANKNIMQISPRTTLHGLKTKTRTATALCCNRFPGGGVYRETVLSNWVIARISTEMINELMLLSIDHTSKKVINSMDQGQDGLIRTQDVKFQKQLMGTLAEKATAKFLELILEKNQMQEDWQTIIYDDVKKDFTYGNSVLSLRFYSD